MTNAYHPYDLPSMNAQRKWVADAAEALLSGRLGIIEGSRLIKALLPTVSSDPFDPDFSIFVAIESETDALPVGKTRDLWDARVLPEMDSQIQQAEARYRDAALSACKILVERFKN